MRLRLASLGDACSFRLASLNLTDVHSAKDFDIKKLLKIKYAAPIGATFTSEVTVALANAARVSLVCECHMG